MIRNVAFDFGGVTVGYDPAGYVEGLYGKSERGRYILDNVFGSPSWAMLDMGTVTRAEVYAPMLERADRDGHGEDVRYVLEHWAGDMLGTKEDTVELIGELRARGAHVYYLTNMPADIWDMLIARGLRDIFEGGVASFEVHLTKPDIRIYERLLQDTGIKPEETVFFDDMERNVAGARAAGIRGELFTGAESARETLRALGVIED